MKERRLHRAIWRGALLLALALLAQSLRLAFLLPPLLSVFLIGAPVNALLLLAARYAGSFPALAMSALLPLVAFMQGQLALPPLILAVAAGNAVFALLYRRRRAAPLLWLLPAVKAIVLYGGASLIVRGLGIPAPLADVVLLAMSWPQLVAAAAGLWLAERIAAKLPDAFG